jgi:hypothetical protein
LTEILTDPFLVDAAALTIEADDYTSALNSAKLTPTTPLATFRDIGGGTRTVAGKPAWVFDLGAAQDWGPDSSLVHYLRINHGQTKTATLTPDDGGRSVTFTFVCISTDVLGAAGGIASSTVQLPVNGQPVWDPAGA